MSFSKKPKKSKYRLTYKDSGEKPKTFYTSSVSVYKDFVKNANDEFYDTGRKATASVLNPKTNRFKKRLKVGW